jgi:hypothetical protein
VAALWSAGPPKDDTKVVRKKRLEIDDTVTADDDATTAGGDADPCSGGIILENQPIRLEGVIRSDDPSEFQKPLELEKGWAKNMASRFMNQQNDDQSTSARRFKMDVQPGEPEVHENEPVRLEGVVRSGDRTEDVIGKRGTIKSIAGRFANPHHSSSSDSDSDSSDSSSDDRRPSARNRRQPLAARRLQPSTGSDNTTGPLVLSENTPAELDPNVVRSTDGYRANDPVMEAGRTRNMAERWKQQQHEQEAAASGGGSASGKPKPAWLIELENAKESEHGVFENEPEVRDDVVRADDDKPDVISVQHTRSLRKMWTQIERDRDAADKQPKNRPLPKIKPPSPEPEPEPPKPQPKPEEPKPAVGRFGARRPVGRLNIGQLQKEEPAPAPKVVEEPAPAKGPVGRGRRGPTALASAAPAPVAPAQPAVHELESKASKSYVKPTLKQVPLRK